jgi:hypothetical protein
LSLTELAGLVLFARRTLKTPSRRKL